MRRTVVVFFASLVVATLIGAPGTLAQILPLTENHYKVYDVAESPSFVGQIQLSDQFADINVTFAVLDKFANPVNKNGEGIIDPKVHQTWWVIDDPQPLRTVLLENQFGAQTWLVKDGRYLVLPASKNSPGAPPPLWNHYKCYDAVGPALFINVVLDDQFGTTVHVVAAPTFFCNPVAKTVGGVTFPIVDPEAHLACYQLSGINSYLIPISVNDQFIQTSLTVINDCWLCLPSNKLGVVAVEQTTWGQIKALYQN